MGMTELGCCGVCFVIVQIVMINFCRLFQMLHLHVKKMFIYTFTQVFSVESSRLNNHSIILGLIFTKDTKTP